MKKIVLIFCLFFGLNAFAQEEATTLKPKKANMFNLLEQAKKNILSKSPKANVYTASTAVDAHPDDSQYFDFLTSAYNQAVLQLKANIVLRKAGRVAIDEAFEYHRKSIPDNLLNANLKKQVDEKIALLRQNSNDEGMLGIVNVIVNNVVSKQAGGDKKKEQELTAKATENIFNKTYNEGFIKEGFDEISGLIPTDTFIVTNEKGDVEIGVVGYTTKRSIQLARDLNQGRQSKKTSNEANCKSASQIASALKDEDLLEHFGLKYFYNENCRPSLLAYGMDSFIKEEGMNADYRAESVERARGIADKFISNFLSSNVDAFIKDKKLMQKTKDALIEASQKGDKTLYKNKKIRQTSMIKEMSKSFASSSSMNLIGLEDARVWSINMEDFEVIGVMRYYSMDSIEAANEEFNPVLKEQRARKKNKKSGVQHSSNLDVDDF